MTPTSPPSSWQNNPLSLRWVQWVRRGLAVWVTCWLASPVAAFGLCPGELERAKATRQHIDQEWPLRASGDEVTRFIQTLGVRLARFSAGGGEVPWRFAVVRNLAPNAFSIGAGYVYVTEGAVTFAQTEAELAAIIAHELGHELAGHFCSQAAYAESRGLFDVFSDSPPPDAHDVGSGSVRQTIDPRKEEQADQIAVAVLQAAGYDPRALLQVARRLPAGGEAHQTDSRRIAALERILGTYHRSPPLSTPNTEAFTAIKRRLMGDAGLR